MIQLYGQAREQFFKIVGYIRQYEFKKRQKASHGKDMSFEETDTCDTCIAETKAHISVAYDCYQQTMTADLLPRAESLFSYYHQQKAVFESQSLKAGCLTYRERFFARYGTRPAAIWLRMLTKPGKQQFYQPKVLHSMFERQ
jgi:hypothetical protein